MQDMVPGLAVEEFSTPPSSPVLATRTVTVRKATSSAADSVDSKTAIASSSDLHDIPRQLGGTS